jgi:DNA-binding protein YbaB
MDASFDALADQARSALEGTAPPPAENAGADADATSYTATAADGRITAEVGGDGRVRVLRLERELLKQPLEDTAAQVKVAINAALAQRPGTTDYAPVAKALKEIQDQARTDMTAIVGAISDVTQHVREARGLPAT